MLIVYNYVCFSSKVYEMPASFRRRYLKRKILFLPIFCIWKFSHEPKISVLILHNNAKKFSQNRKKYKKTLSNFRYLYYRFYSFRKMKIWVFIVKNQGTEIFLISWNFSDIFSVGMNYGSYIMIINAFVILHHLTCELWL